MTQIRKVLPQIVAVLSDDLQIKSL